MTTTFLANHEDEIIGYRFQPVPGIFSGYFFTAATNASGSPALMGGVPIM
jgi:hypothetical protein